MVYHCADISFFFFYTTPATEIYTLSLHDALPICQEVEAALPANSQLWKVTDWLRMRSQSVTFQSCEDRKSTRLNSSHQIISYAVFCLKKKKKSHRSKHRTTRPPPTPGQGPPSGST